MSYTSVTYRNSVGAYREMTIKIGIAITFPKPINY